MELMVKAMKVQVGSSGRKLVLLKLADNANDYGVCWPSYQHIADQCEMGRSTVKGHIARLEKDGFLTVLERNGGKSSNKYQLHLDKGRINQDDPVKNEPGQDLTRSESDPLTRSESDPRTSHSFEPVNKKTKAKKESSPPRRKPKFEAPSFEQVHAYALERGRQDLAKKFFDYYEAGGWKDVSGKAVRNWKQKFITWENNNPIQHQQGVNHGNGNGNQQFGGFRETESQRARRLNAELSQKARENGFNGSRSRPDHF